MDKKHASCMNMHTNRNVKLLIEKFEGMGERKVELVAGKKSDLNIHSLTGRVAETVAKFEHCSFLGHSRIQLTCGDQATERWLAELKQKMLGPVAQSSQVAVVIEEQQKESQKIHNECFELDVEKSKHKLSLDCSSTSIFNPNFDLSGIPSFNGFEFSSPLMLCSLSRQVMRSVYSCGRALVALGKWLAHVLCRFLPSIGRSDSSLKMLYQN
ncbi:uncharacterized protein LOC135428403 isoform X1 [Drosophila montana]|uniref:uncharacterized protein LOC135428403 isoform X1 n=1 Tax=Drosophila montana TaxID=40370 RepID=UPI00313EEF34